MKACEILDNTTSGTPDALIQYMWRINDRDMVQAYYMMQRIIAPPTGSGLAAHPELAGKWPASGTGGAWSTLTAPIDDATLSGLIACDLTPPPNPACNTTPGGNPVCNATCPCPGHEGTCFTDADCPAGLKCGIGNGPRFGFTRAVNFCWNPSCATLPATPPYCGAADALCGSSCDNANICDKDSDCPTGEICGTNNGSRFGVPVGRVCWRPECITDPTGTGCGTIFSPCGLCGCTPDVTV
jgi:hypothetical protein